MRVALYLELYVPEPVHKYILSTPNTCLSIQSNVLDAQSISQVSEVHVIVEYPKYFVI